MLCLGCESTPDHPYRLCLLLFQSTTLPSPGHPPGSGAGFARCQNARTPAGVGGGQVQGFTLLQRGGMPVRSLGPCSYVVTARLTRIEDPPRRTSSR